jgi:hypothetical protein
MARSDRFDAQKIAAIDEPFMPDALARKVRAALA